MFSSLFGSKVITVKPLIKQTIKLLDHRDKNVRESVKSLFIEIYRWIGPAIRAPLQNINAVAVSYTVISKCNFSNDFKHHRFIFASNISLY